MARYHIKHEPTPSALEQCVSQIEKQLREFRDIEYGPVGYRDACQEAIARLERFIDCDAYEHPPRMPKLPASEEEEAVYARKCIRYLEALVRLGNNGKPTPSPHTGSRRPKSQKPRKDQRKALILAAVNMHHGYCADGSIKNWEPIGVNELTSKLSADADDQMEISPPSGATISRWFADNLDGHDAYITYCRMSRDLPTHLKRLNGDLPSMASLEKPFDLPDDAESVED